MYLHLGEQAIWPGVAMIGDQALVSRTFRECISGLEETARRTEGYSNAGRITSR